MRLGFYYHISFKVENDSYYVPSYLGVFLNSLAQEVAQLTILFHEANADEFSECDFHINAKNINWVSLGKKTPAWHRGFFAFKTLSILKNQTLNIDALLVRSPSPLAPFFYRYFDRNKLWFLIVGDYLEGAKNNHPKGIRNRMIQFLLKNNHQKFLEQIAKTKSIVNSPSLFEKYKTVAPKIFSIKTTTLSTTDFYKRVDTLTNNTIKILYTGRIDMAKGLKELMMAFSQINNIFNNIELHFVGWEYNEKEPVKKALINIAETEGISSKIYFHGKKKVGNELNQMYRMADIYVIPSYHEGFPRTIWEAMANSIPVIATKVGAIPEYLSHLENAILIEPKNVSEISNAIVKLVNDSELRKKLIHNAFELVQENTLEFQSKKLVEIIQANTKDE